MPTLLEEILQQPQALHNLTQNLRLSHGDRFQHASPLPHLPVLTGMGASYHAAWISGLHLIQAGCPTFIIEAADLVNYTAALLQASTSLVYVSQSGASGEVYEILKLLQEGSKARLVAVTNQPASPLAQAAQVILPLYAGNEDLVATKTYLNSQALLWYLVRQWTGNSQAGDLDILKRITESVENLLSEQDQLVSRLVDTFDVEQGILFLGHGPHAATARQSAMMLGEWPKVPALSAGIAAFRHGFIESVHPGMGVVVFASPGRTQASAQRLALELQDYGARVLVVQNGRIYLPGQTSSSDRHVDEFLSPMLDVIPIQLYADALAKLRGIEFGFRHISKVVQKL
jgi:glutamine---fructose-6-phosphate transaminase (isomerizing)